MYAHVHVNFYTHTYEYKHIFVCIHTNIKSRTDGNAIMHRVAACTNVLCVCEYVYLYISNHYVYICISAHMHMCKHIHEGGT